MTVGHNAMAMLMRRAGPGRPQRQPRRQHGGSDPWTHPQTWQTATSCVTNPTTCGLPMSEVSARNPGTGGADRPDNTRRLGGSTPLGVHVQPFSLDDRGWEVTTTAPDGFLQQLSGPHPTVEDTELARDFPGAASGGCVLLDGCGYQLWDVDAYAAQ